MCFHILQGISMNELAFGRTLSVSLENIDCLDGVTNSQGTLHLNGVDSIDNQLREELGISTDEFAGH